MVHSTQSLTLTAVRYGTQFLLQQDDADAVDNDTMKQRNDEEEGEEGRKDADAGEVSQPAEQRPRWFEDISQLMLFRGAVFRSKFDNSLLVGAGLSRAGGPPIDRSVGRKLNK